MARLWEPSLELIDSTAVAVSSRDQSTRSLPNEIALAEGEPNGVVERAPAVLGSSTSIVGANTRRENKEVWTRTVAKIVMRALCEVNCSQTSPKSERSPLDRNQYTRAITGLRCTYREKKTRSWFVACHHEVTNIGEYVHMWCITDSVFTNQTSIASASRHSFGTHRTQVSVLRKVWIYR